MNPEFQVGLEALAERLKQLTNVKVITRDTAGGKGIESTISAKGDITTDYAEADEKLRGRHNQVLEFELRHRAQVLAALMRAIAIGKLL